ncbi:hypothetical protein D1872_295750 [compost metagenome]
MPFEPKEEPGNSLHELNRFFFGDAHGEHVFMCDAEEIITPVFLQKTEIIRQIGIEPVFETSGLLFQNLSGFRGAAKNVVRSLGIHGPAAEHQFFHRTFFDQIRFQFAQYLAYS